MLSRPLRFIPIVYRAVPGLSRLSRFQIFIVVLKRLIYLRIPLLIGRTSLLGDSLSRVQITFVIFLSGLISTDTVS